MITVSSNFEALVILRDPKGSTGVIRATNGLNKLQALCKLGPVPGMASEELERLLLALAEEPRFGPWLNATLGSCACVNQLRHSTSAAPPPHTHTPRARFHAASAADCCA